MGKNHRVVNSLLSAQQVVINRHVHGTGEGLEKNFRLGAAVIGGVDSQGIGGVREGGPAGVIKVKTSPAAAAGQKVGAVVGEVRDGSAGLVDGEGNNAVREDHRPAVVGHGNIGAGAGAAAGHIGVQHAR